MANHTYNAITLTGLLSAGLLYSVSTQALEISVGDYEPLPDQLNLAILYLNTTSGSDYYNKGKKVSDNFKLDTQVAIVRLLHNIELSNGVMMEPQIVVPYGSLTTSGEANVLGDADGQGDAILGLPFKWTLNTANKDVLALAPFLYTPSGNYDKSQELNMGENRWRLLLQSTYIRHFNAHWALDSAADASWYSANNDYQNGTSKLEQGMRYELQSYLRYKMDDNTMLGAGLGHIGGAERRINGVSQNDSQSTTYLRATISHFVAPQWQLQGLFGKDLEVKQGIKQDTQFQLRIVRVF